jgi:hypothetical protein
VDETNRTRASERALSEREREFVCEYECEKERERENGKENNESAV